MPSDLTKKVVLIDYSRPMFEPVGFEAVRLAEVGARWETYECRTAQQVVDVAADADVVVVQSVRPLLTREVLAQLERCRCTIRAGAGYDSIDYEAATELGMMICNTPTYCTDEVADHAVALMLACVRHIPELDAAMHRGSHDSAPMQPTRRLRGNTLGVIGLGRIGSTTARRVAGWGMQVVAYDPYVDQEHADTIGVQMVSLEELLQRSDFVSIHCLLNEETFHLLSWDQFAIAKPALILVNTARGPIVHEEALIKALENHRVWMAGLDVTEQEPLPADSPLAALDNVVLTPHVAAISPESRVDLYHQICDVSADVVQGRIPEFVVNPEVLNHLRQVG